MDAFYFSPFLFLQLQAKLRSRTDQLHLTKEKVGRSAEIALSHSRFNSLPLHPHLEQSDPLNCV